ncbi:hypothetical protein [Pseudonocardia halophobica]|uniref:hypothetical protein n=1 Tax=Pseudonocardia halophobica TaxID=29401 RepID=UPI0034DABAC7
MKSAQRLGFTLDEVAELLDTGRRRHPTPGTCRPEPGRSWPRCRTASTTSC